MHIFLSGPKGIGKSTVISKTLDILTAEAPIELGGFFTWNGGEADPHIFMRPAQSGRGGEIYRLASHNSQKGGLDCDIHVFEQDGARILREKTDPGLIIMDELGFLESGAPLFREAVLDTLAGSVPVFGVLRQDDIPWHNSIKENPFVTLFDVNENNRGDLPRNLARLLKLSIIYKEVIG